METKIWFLIFVHSLLFAHDRQTHTEKLIQEGDEANYQFFKLLYLKCLEALTQWYVTNRIEDIQIKTTF